MKKLFLILAFLFPASAFATSRAITVVRFCGTDALLTGQPSARLNTRVAEIDVTTGGVITIGGTYAFGLGTNNTPAAATVVFTVTSQGYPSPPTLSTVTRTVYAQIHERQASPNQSTADEIQAAATNCAAGTVAAGTLTLRVILSDFVYAADTATVVIGAGLYTSAGDTTSAFSGSVTNNVASLQRSTGLYEQSICRWAQPPLQKVSSSFTLEVVCVNRHPAGQGKYVSGVAFSVVDAHSVAAPVVTVTIQTKSTWGPDVNPVIVYAATIDASGLTQGDALTANFTAYPYVGDATSLVTSSTVTGRVVRAVKGASGAAYAVGDTGVINGTSCTTKPTYQVISLTVTAVNVSQIVSSGAGCAGDAVAVSTTAGGDQAGIGTGLTYTLFVGDGTQGTENLSAMTLLLDKTGTLEPAAYIDPVNGVALATSPCTSASPCNVGATLAAAEAAYVGSTAVSYKTYGDAVAAVKAYNNRVNGHNDPGGGIGVLVDCSAATGVACNSINGIDVHRFPGVAPGDLNAQNAWFTIQPRTGVTAVKARIEDYTGAACNGNNIGFGIRALKMTGVDVLDVNTCLATIKGTSTTSQLWMDRSTINLNDVTAGIDILQTGYATFNTVPKLNPSGFTFVLTHGPWALVRGNNITNATPIFADQYTVLGNNNIKLNQIATQNGSSVQANSDNSIVAYNTLYSLATGTAFQTGCTGCVNGSPNIDRGVAFVQNLIEKLCTAACNSGSPLFGFLADGNSGWSHNVIIEHNTFIGERESQGYNDGTSGLGVAGTTLHTTWRVVGNIFPTLAHKTDTFVTANAARVLNWGVWGQTGNYGNWNWPNTAYSPIVGPLSWLGPMAGLYSSVVGSQVSTGGVSYVAIKNHTAVTATNKPGSGTGDATCPTWQTCWDTRGSTVGFSAPAWANGTLYYAEGLTSDKSGYSGDNAGAGTYTLLSTSNIINLYPIALDPVPYDLAGRARWTGDSGAFANPTDAPVGGVGGMLLRGVGP